MAEPTTASGGLETLYGLMTSLDRAMKALVKDGVDVDHLQARDLYERNLDCQNLGAHAMLVAAADVVAEHTAPQPGELVLDIGCGMGGPGRFLADRFGCSVLGVDLLALRVEAAEALTERTGLGDRISYRVASATELGVDDASFAQVWMLDVGIHVADKQALFAEIARVLRPGGAARDARPDRTAPAGDGPRHPRGTVHRADPHRADPPRGGRRPATPSLAGQHPQRGGLLPSSPRGHPSTGNRSNGAHRTRGAGGSTAPPAPTSRRSSTSGAAPASSSPNASPRPDPSSRDQVTP